METSPKKLWDKCLSLIKGNVTEQQYDTWFRPIVFEKFAPKTQTLLVKVPSPFVYEYLEQNFVDLLSKVLHHYYGEKVRLTYRIVTDNEHKISQDIEADPANAVTPQPKTRANEAPSLLDQHSADLDSNLNAHLTFNNYIEGDSNKLPRSIGASIAEHPNTTQFNPLFLYGPSGCGKTHLISAIGNRTKQLYPQKRVLYISAKLFQVQFTQAVISNRTNDFIGFYQTIDMLIVDDIQEWMGKGKTLDTFFHIFNHLFKNGKRIILASDRPPVELKDMPDRLLTRFSCGLIAELENPNKQLCVDILKDLIRKNGLNIPEDVIYFIAENADGSVRDLQGVINGLLAYSITYGGDINLKLAERCIKRAIKMEDKHTLTIDDIVTSVCNHYEVSATSINSRSRKHELVVARQVSMYLAQKYTRIPTSRIGRMIGNRDHSTVIHSCTAVENLLKANHAFAEEVASIENSFKLKKA